MRELAQLPTPAIAKRILLIVRCSFQSEVPAAGRPGTSWFLRNARQLVGPAEVVDQGCAQEYRPAPAGEQTSQLHECRAAQVRPRSVVVAEPLTSRHQSSWLPSVRNPRARSFLASCTRCNACTASVTHVHVGFVTGQMCGVTGRPEMRGRFRCRQVLPTWCPSICFRCSAR